MFVKSKVLQNRNLDDMSLNKLHFNYVSFSNGTSEIKVTYDDEEIANVSISLDLLASLTKGFEWMREVAEKYPMLVNSLELANSKDELCFEMYSSLPMYT